MGTKSPSNTPLLGMTSPTFVFVDPVLAKASIPLGIDARQHALATSKFMPGICTIVNKVTAAGTFDVYVPVPPSVMYMQVSFVMQGDAKFTLQTTHTTVTKEWIYISLYDDVNGVNWGSTTYGFTETSNSALKVRSGSDPTSVAWDWTSAKVTMSFTAVSGAPNAGKLHAVYFRPIFVTQTV
tara:strand:+ start:9072 stop:9617 length:546 start_codon:yes stop_codon:yes gene_type:complete